MISLLCGAAAAAPLSVLPELNPSILTGTVESCKATIENG